MSIEPAEKRYKSRMHFEFWYHSKFSTQVKNIYKNSKMCQQIISSTAASANNQKIKPSYSIKKVLKTLFKKHQKQQQQQNVANSLESLDNMRNSQMEEQFYAEIEDNSANEKLAVIEAEEEEQDIYVPVRFARTNAGTFFWTTNLQPVTSTIAPSADADLLEPAYCYSSSEYPAMQFQDRWAQA